MSLRSLGAGVAIAAVVIGGAAASGSRGVVVPRFTLGATTATVDDEVALRVGQAPTLPPGREIRLYLVPAGVARAVLSRFDSRLSFVGTVRASRHARLVFTVPPLAAGSYALAYWCRGCLPHGKSIGSQASPLLRVNAPAGEACPTTKPNGNVPRGAPTSWSGFQWHGNGALWVFLRPDGVLMANALGGWKQVWVAEQWVSESLAVHYRMLDPASAPLTARVGSGTLTGYDGPSWASRMSFQPGCWQITGRRRDVTLSFVVQVALGDA